MKIENDEINCTEEDRINFNEITKKNRNATYTAPLTIKNNLRRLQKALDIEKITRKRAKKILMSKGIQRNEAEMIVRIFNEYYGVYIHGVILTIAKHFGKMED